MTELFGGKYAMSLPSKAPVYDMDRCEIEADFVGVDTGGMMAIGSSGLTAGSVSGSGGGFWSNVFKGMFTIAVMGVNAFCAAIATQVYRLFTKRWREGGGSDIPVINTAPGDGSPSNTQRSSPTGHGPVSSDFLNRYRD